MIQFECFESLYEHINKHSGEDILRACLFDQLKLTNNNIPEDMSVEDIKTLFDRDELRIADNKSEYFEKAIDDLKDNLQKYKWVHDILLKDDKSKRVFLDLLAYRITGNVKCLKVSQEDEPHYFNPNIFKYTEAEVYVDCGAYVGDTIIEFAAACPLYKKIYAYEAIPQVYETCRSNVSALMEAGNIEVRNYAVFDENCELKFEFGNGVGDSKVTSLGEISVKARTLDDDISEKISFIKMDIEGSEKAALMGAKRHIQEDTPKLAVCVYHLTDDFWRIPELICEINGNYNFLIRHHGNYKSYDSVLYCVPKAKEVGIGATKSPLDTAQKLSRFVAINQYLAYWPREKMEHYESTEDAKLWLREQLGSYCKSHQEQNAAIEEMRSWSSQLEEAKEYSIKECEKNQEAIRQLNAQNSQLNELNGKSMAEINDLKLLCSQLSKEKDEYKNMLDAETAKPWYKKIFK